MTREANQPLAFGYLVAILILSFRYNSSLTFTKPTKAPFLMQTSQDELPENEFVISVPGAEGGEAGLKEFGIYEFPAQEGFKYCLARYIAPRKDTTAMRRIFRIDKFLVFNPSNARERDAAITQASLSIDQRRRLLAFLAKQETSSQTMRYFVTDGTFESLRFNKGEHFQGFPKISKGGNPAKNNEYRCYFRREALLAKPEYIDALPVTAYGHLDYYPLV